MQNKSHAKKLGLYKRKCHNTAYLDCFKESDFEAVLLYILHAIGVTLNTTRDDLTFIPPTASCLVAITLPWASIRCLNTSCFYVRALNWNKLVTTGLQPSVSEHNS